MITTIKLSVFFGVFLIVAAFLPVVTELPFGLDAPMVFFATTIKGVTTLMPWMQTVWDLILLALFIEFLLQTWEWSQRFLHWVASVI